jgi:hypothetical protein
LIEQIESLDQFATSDVVRAQQRSTDDEPARLALVINKTGLPFRRTVAQRDGASARSCRTW